jgi:hypothetical protein
VDEREQSGGTRQNPPAQPTNEVVVDDSAAQPTYANFCRVTSTPEEVVLDFGLNPQPFAPGRQAVKSNQRVVMNYYTAKRLLAAMDMTVQRHEQTFGSIELDVSRRVSPQQLRSAPAVVHDPAGQPEPVRLA